MQTKPFQQFLNEVEDLRIAMRWRDGQALFNHLFMVYPDLAQKIRGTHIDPFFIKKDHDTYKACLDYLEANWEVNNAPS